jgi:DeoR family fructose operon transcriptional repressor
MKTAIKKIQREQSILYELRKKGHLKTIDATRLLGMSECSVRRFFLELEEKGTAVRYHGGIKLVPVKSDEYRFENYQFHQSEQKQRIGEFGSRLVENGDIIFLDTGTTIQQMALHLVERFRKGDLQDVQIFTNSLRNLNILMDHYEVNLIGGLFRGKRQDFCGYLSEMVLNSISFNKCFTSTDGVSLNPADGVMASDIYTAKINEIVIRRASASYLLADSSKFSRRSFIKYAEIQDIHMIVTDTALDDALCQAIIEKGGLIQKV